MTAQRKPVILLTRPQAQAEATAKHLMSLGYDVLSAPMLRIETLDYDRPDLSLYDGLIFTSVNAVRAFAPPKDALNMPVYCVGEKTADMLRNAGYEGIEDISGNIELLENAMQDAAGRYLHICGADVVRPLDVDGVRVDALPVYKAHKVTEFSPDIAEKLTQRDVDIVLFYSARTGQAFVDAVNNAGCTSALGSIKALCLSDLVLNSIKELPWQSVHVSDAPNGDALIQALHGLLSH